MKFESMPLSSIPFYQGKHVSPSLLNWELVCGKQLDVCLGYTGYIISSQLPRLVQHTFLVQAAGAGGALNLHEGLRMEGCRTDQIWGLAELVLFFSDKNATFRTNSDPNEA